MAYLAAYFKKYIMLENTVVNYIKNVLTNLPKDWLHLTTHRLDIYNEELAKTAFLYTFENLFKSNNYSSNALNELPTAFDYIRLGHPLSCVLEWTIANLNQITSDHVISFSSESIPILAVLRKNIFEKKNTLLLVKNELPKSFDIETVKKVYGYQFQVQQLESTQEIPDFEGTTILFDNKKDIYNFDNSVNVDFIINIRNDLGSILLVNGDDNKNYISEIQHVRRRETIAMTPANTLIALQELTNSTKDSPNFDTKANKTTVLKTIKEITGVNTNAVVGSSGLSIQYAIVMGLIDHAIENYNNRPIKIVVPPNCYGGTNDQARRVAACLNNVEVMDLPVDGGYDMVNSIDRVLETIAKENAVPYIIAEIPTNPRVEVPDLLKLKEVLSKERKTTSNERAIEPVFILDQTFCPNVHFLGDNEILSSVKTIAYVSGSKFPSGGRCTAGYCTANTKAAYLMDKIAYHIQLCDNEATDLQLQILAAQMPSMNQRIESAYKNTREFVTFIEEVLPEAKINFVSEELAQEGFTPSVFSLDLPTKGNTKEERETYKRALNLKLIDLMITQIPDESKYCVSYGQLKGCYWTIPATSTQGTTKEEDKDYIARVALSGNMDLEKHKEVFLDFVKSL
ncbi:Cys/Met metabolism PLP-dependent enzyme [Tenacibaculum skagerrakense]|uniref:Cys/Met metabolism PLP-dependent enzyme n=2 Tax=Tenacibaculum skagerrakense TaxID=186571 RepID=A0A4R2NPS6_9FLAO|nr:Cys/Met metabolism PLP-dependent enzyme [Tenacibaculum skagerrakense]